MLPQWLLFLLSAAYVGLLFALAWWGDRNAARTSEGRPRPLTYSLALAVYCTSWTFYGAVGRAAESGWDYLPIYLGPMLVFLFGAPLLERLLQLCRRHNITSLADFIGARYGRRQLLAALVTVIAVIGILPYLALQLKAVAVSMDVLIAPDSRSAGWFSDGALVTAFLLAVFAILFGTRQVSSRENHHGLVLAVAFESVVKLVAFLAVGLYATYSVFGGAGDAITAALSQPRVAAAMARPDWMAGFLAQTVLAMAAILCLPRQFHIMVVENSDPGDLRTARWVFPGYLALISLFVLPIAGAGALLLGSGVAPDTYVLNLPLQRGDGGLALLAYIGGFSAATSMVIVSTIALSTMLSNELVMPLLLRWQPLGLARGSDLSGLIKTVRRVAIVALLILAYLYTRFFAAGGTLTSIGLLSFAAVLQFAPALLGGLYWKRGTHQGVLAGLVVGFAMWGYTLMLPTLLGSEAPLVRDGPLGLSWLRPQGLLGIDWLDAVTHGTVWSLACNLLGYVLGSRWFVAGLRDHLHAVRFIGEAEPDARPREIATGNATVGDLRALLERFFGAPRAAQHLHDYGARIGVVLHDRDRATPELVRASERSLAGALGASSARVVMAAMLRGRDMQVEDVIQLLDETSHALQFSRELLQATLEHLPQGVSVVDHELRLVAWNRRYVQLFGYPDELIVQGRPIEDLIRHNAGQGLIGGRTGVAPAQDVEALVARRLEHMRAGRAHEHERAMPDGTVIQIRGNPMPGGGFVTSYTDVTEYKRQQAHLQELADTLEQRVRERTEELSRLAGELATAKASADRANAAKTRFLAAASHDLVQPISAARLFLAAVDRERAAPELRTLVHNVEGALAAAERLLSALLDISRLDAGALPVRREHLRLSAVLAPLAAEFSVLAKERGLELRARSCAAVVFTDPGLLRRILQNFLSNALRYTPSGRVLLGCRRTRGGVRIEVWDTGPGIPASRQQEIFEEFRRLRSHDTRGESGLGLGLAIAERTARLLGHDIGMRSTEGRGSLFWVRVPLGNPAALSVPGEPPARSAPAFDQPRVLCIENEAAVLAGMKALLESWGCRVVACASLAEAEAHWRGGARAPDLALVDYHLDDGVSGIDALDTLRRTWQREVPGIVVTADHTPQARQAAIDRGYAFLPKPVAIAKLRALVNRILGERVAESA
ncbi:PAS domain-containing hybrid sensor histidine kinase/response regulator [Fontimonas sp. SYSU GA230001]|uniref:PAS domain-containing hybrid sensor histidine kinase/response regulator n=1 Tax=Fontimonas sp. SYSU GA230001 TaxID=3142450 RepID=UPI0032B3C5CE